MSMHFRRGPITCAVILQSSTSNLNQPDSRKLAEEFRSQTVSLKALVTRCTRNNIGVIARPVNVHR